MKDLRRGFSLGVASLLFVASAMVHAQDAGSGEATVRTLQMVPARAYLSKTLDAKKAKQGDPVTAKLLDDVKVPGAQVLPKGTLLVGHIDQVQPSENKGDSSVQVTFDKAQLKGGQEVPVKTTVMQISPPNNGMQAAGGAPVSDGAPMAGSAPMSGGSGGRGSMAPPPTSNAQMPPPTSDTPASQPSGVEGVTLQSDIHQSNSGTFVSKGRNVHVPEGTQMQFAVTIVPANTHMQ